MNIVLSAIAFDPLGVVALECKPGQTLGEVRRRVNRIATLDGGAVFNDFGYTEADRLIRLVWQPTDTDVEASVVRLLTLYATLHLSTPEGVFLAAPEVYKPGAAESTLTLLVSAKLS